MDGVKAAGSILIVDDSPIALGVAAEVLRGAGYTVFTTESWFEASTIASRGVDVMLLDVEMPNLPGPRICPFAKRLFPELKVVLYSGRPQAELDQIAAGCGADGAIQKSNDPARLPSLVSPFFAMSASGRFSRATVFGPSAVERPSRAEAFAAAPLAAPPAAAAPARPARAAAPQARAPGDGARKPRVVLVDDSDAYRGEACASLRAAGVEVEETSDWARVSGLVDSFQPDCVFLDVVMPGVRGDVICRTLRARHATLPIYLVSSLSSSELDEIARRCGASDTVTKAEGLSYLSALAREAARLA